jgi:hypothetical protein
MKGSGLASCRGVNWRKIPITLKIPLQNRGGGERTAQACANACFRHLSKPRLQLGHAPSDAMGNR